MPLLRKSDLPDTDDLIDALPMVKRRDRVKPIVFGCSLLAVGSLLLRASPNVGNVPDPKPYGSSARRSKRRRAAERLRDASASFAPTNLTDQLGKSLIMGGTALLVARMMDEYVGPGGD